MATQKTPPKSVQGLGAVKCDSSGAAIVAVTHKNVALVDSRLIAKALGRRHASTFELIKDRLPLFGKAIGEGIVRFETDKLSAGAGRPVKYALLTEGQALLLLTLMRNSPNVVQAKAAMIHAFKKAREAKAAHETQYLPLHHQCHDAIKAAADRIGGDARHTHSNIERMINAAVGIPSGARDGLPAETKGLISQAYALAGRAFSTEQDPKAAYRQAKATVTALVALMRPAASALEVRHA